MPRKIRLRRAIRRTSPSVRVKTPVEARAQAELERIRQIERRLRNQKRG